MKRDNRGKFIQVWDGEPKQAVKLSLTRTAWQALEQQAGEQGISRSELVERYARSLQTSLPLDNNEGAKSHTATGAMSLQDVGDRKQIEQTQRFLAQASQTFAAANLNLQAILDTITRLVSEFTGDVCVLNLLSEDGQWLENASLYYADPEVRMFAKSLLYKYPLPVNEGIGGRVMQTGEPLLITSEAVYRAAVKPEYRQYLDRFQVSSLLTVPLKVRGQAIGVLSLNRHAPAEAHDLEDQQLMQELADRAAMAIANARLYQQAKQARKQAERTADRTARLQSVTAALSESLALNQVAGVISEQVIPVLNAASVLVAIVTEQGNELEIIHYLGDEQDISEEWRRFPISLATPLTDAVRTGQPIWEESLEERSARYPHLAEAYAKVKYPAWISLPLMLEGRAIGGMTITFGEVPHVEEDDRSFMLALAQQCAQAIARTQLYEAEQRARAQAEAANRTKDEFLAILSHELRTPLNPILGWARLLRMGKLDSNKTAIALETIERNARLQTQLIEDLLDVSRILKGKLTLHSAPVDLKVILTEAIATVHLAAEAKAIQIQASFAPEECSVLGDVARLQQVAWNLLTNAVKFTPTGGQVAVQLITTSTYAEIQVKDTGKGIEPEFLPYIFDAFRQADSSTTRTFGGLGLGLAIVHHIVELHGGTVSADSLGEGQGTTFTVRLPLLFTPMTTLKTEALGHPATE